MNRSEIRTVTGSALTVLLLTIAFLVSRHGGPSPEHPFLTAARDLAPAMPSQTGRQPHHTPICDRSPEAARDLLVILEQDDCETADPAGLARIEGDAGLMVAVDALETGDLDGLWNLTAASVAAGNDARPLPPGIFRDLRAVADLSVTTAGHFRPGLLDGLTLLRRAHLAHGYNALRPPRPGGPAIDVRPAETSVQERLPADRLCPAPWLAELSLWTPAEPPPDFFDCVPKLTSLEIGNLTPDGRNEARPYRLDLRQLRNLQSLAAPALPGGAARRPVELAVESPLYRDLIRRPQDGPESCPEYIQGRGWLMCLD